MSVDWSRVAEPQKDDYDTSVVLALRASGPATAPTRRENGGHRIFGGAVEVRELEGPYASLEGFTSAPLDSPQIARAEELVSRWPPVFRQFQALVHTFYPMHNEAWQLDGRALKGSASHAFESHVGTLCATVGDPVGLAQALVHELGHTKLRSLGIWLETAERLILNDPEELFESPVRKDKPRPMTAVFHAEYSFIYVTQLDLVLLQGGDDEDLHGRTRELLARNVPRVRDGFETIRRHVRVDRDGRRFIDGFLAWAERVITAGERRLASSA